MRITIALAAACALTVPAFAQTLPRGKPAAQAKSAPKADPLAQSYAALPEADRI
ncbi:MAG: hypothetical protein IT538_06240, partial [Variibacter sp.]|nr:hypothetical protein [Variibacter sp.]